MSVANDDKRIARNTLLLYVRLGVSLVVALFTTRIVIRALGVEDYGVQNVVAGFVSMFAFLNTSFATSVQRFYNVSLGKQDGPSVTDVYNVSLRIHAGLSVLLALLLETVGLWYMYHEMVIPAGRFTAAMYVFQSSVLSLVLVVMQIPYSAAIMAHERMDFYSGMSIFDVVARLAVAFSLTVVTADRLKAYAFMQLAVSLVCFLLYCTYAKHCFRDLKFRRTFSRPLLRPMMSFSGWNVFGTFAYMMKEQGVNMLLNVFFGAVVNAARGVSFMILSAVQGFQFNMANAFRPQMTSSYAAGDHDRCRSLFMTLSKLSFILVAMLALPVMLEADALLHLWLGDAVPGYAAGFTVLVLACLLVTSLNTPVTIVVNATGRISRYLCVTSAIILMIVPVSWLLLRLGFDAPSVYVVSIVMCTVNQAVSVILLKRVFDYSISRYLRRIILPCLLLVTAAPLPALLARNCFETSITRVALTSVTAVTTVIITSYVFILDKTERQLLVGLLHRSRHHSGMLDK